MNRKTRIDLERAMAKRESELLKRKNACNYWTAFSTHHLSWMKELVSKYKESGEYPPMPMLVLPSYYPDVRDKEVAVFASLLIKDDGNFDRINDIRKMITANPFDWFKERGFVRLSLGKAQNRRTGGVENWKIAKLFDRLWEICHITTADTPVGTTISFVRPIGFQVELMAKAQDCSFCDVLTQILQGCPVVGLLYKIRLLLLILGRFGGFSINLWTVPPDEIKSPHTGKSEDFLKLWMPDYIVTGGFDEAVGMFALDNPGDFFYACLAWEKLCKLYPKACERYLSIYKGWYKRKDLFTPHEWKRIQPDISFGCMPDV